MKSRNIEDHICYACECGSVQFNLLKSGKIECAGCNEQLFGRIWAKQTILRSEDLPGWYTDKENL